MAFAHADYCALVASIAALERAPGDATAAAKLRELQEKRAGDPAGLGLVMQEIVLCLRAGLAYNPRRQAWLAPEEASRGGRPRNPHIEAAWGIARAELLVKLGREPMQTETAAHLLAADDLRLIGDIKAIEVESLLRERRRARTKPAE